MGRAVADYEGANSPEDDEETGAGEDAPVKEEDRDFCEGDGRVVEDQVCEDDLLSQEALVC